MKIETIQEKISQGKYIISFTHLIITAYEPDPAEWESDGKTRKRR